MAKAKSKRASKKSMPCNKPRRQTSGGKKFVVKACQGGKEKIIRFGDANMSIKKSQPARKKSYCARSLGQLKRSSAKTRNNPNSRIRQARRRWKC